jgi:hypothetical protein
MANPSFWDLPGLGYSLLGAFSFTTEIEMAAKKHNQARHVGMNPLKID